MSTSQVTPSLPQMPNTDTQDVNQELNTSLNPNAATATPQQAMQAPANVPAPSTPASVPVTTQGVPMISPNRTDTRIVPQSQQADAAQAGWEHATKMVHPTTQDKRWVPASQVSDAMKSGYVHTEAPAASTESHPFQGLGSAAADMGKGLLTSGVVGAAKTAYQGITEDIPAVYKAYESARQTGASVIEAYKAADAKAREINDAKNQLTQAVKEFQTNPNKAAWSAVLQLGTVALGGAMSDIEAVPEAVPETSPIESGNLLTSPAGVADIPKPNVLQQLVKGEKVTQQPTQTALRTAAGNEGGNASVSLRKVMQPSVDRAFTEAKSLYKPIDDAAGTDFKGLYDKLDAAMEKERLTAPGSVDEAKALDDIKKTQDAIGDAKATAQKAGIPDVDKALSQADRKFTEAQANKDLNAKLFNNQSVVRGNLKYGTNETVNVDKAIDVLENLDKPNKYGVSRLRQTSLGEQGADKLLQDLYDAQKAGQKAVSRQQLLGKILKWTGISGGVLAGGAELIHKMTE